MAHPQLPHLFLLLLTFMPFLVSSLSIRAGSEINGYTISGPMGFKGTIHGVEVELSGTVEEIYSTFTTLYPTIVANAIAHGQGLSNSSLSSMSDFNTTTATYLPAGSGLETRDPNPGDHYCCPIAGQPPWNPALVSRIVEGIDYLNNFNGVCNTGGGPSNCVRVSCSYSSGIYLCNDNRSDLVISCKDVAFYAGQLINDCHVKWGDGWHTCGQIFDKGNYNVIVRMDSC